MKVLHITYTDAGGAGIAATRIHKSLCQQGIESSMLVADKTSFDDGIYTAETCFTPSYIPPKNRVLRKIMKTARKRGHFLSTLERYDRLVNLIPSAHKTFFTSPLSPPLTNLLSGHCTMRTLHMAASITAGNVNNTTLIMPKLKMPTAR